MPFHPTLEAFFEEKNAKLNSLKLTPQNIVGWTILDFQPKNNPNTNIQVTANRYINQLGVLVVPTGKSEEDGLFTRTFDIHRRHIRDVMIAQNVIDNTDDIVGTVEVTAGQTSDELADEFGAAIAAKWNIDSSDLFCGLTLDGKLSVTAKRNSGMYYGQVYITGLTISN